MPPEDFAYSHSLLPIQFFHRAFDLLHALLGYRQILRHGAAQLLDSLAHLLPHLVMRLIGALLAADIVPLQLLFGLRGTEQIGRQLVAAHVVEYLLALLQPLAGMNVLRPHAAVQALVAVILKDRIVERRIHAGIFGSGGELFIVLGQFVAYCQTLLAFRQAGEFLVVVQLLTPRLHRKISLPVGDHRLGRIAVLHDQVASITGKSIVLDFALGSRANIDHFSRLGKMVIGLISRLTTSLYRLLNNALELVPRSVFQQRLQLAGRPAFVSLRILLADTLKSGVMLIGDALGVHGDSPAR